MSFQKKIGLILFGAVLILVLGVLFLPQAFINWQKKKIEAQVHESCSSCQLKIGDISYSLLAPGLIQITSLNYVTGTGHALETKFSAAQIRIEFEPKKLFEKLIDIRQIEIKTAEVQLEDIDQMPPQPPTESKGESEFHFNIQRLHFSNAQLKYNRQHHKTSATIMVNHIRGDIKDLTDIKRPNSQLSTGHFDLNIEKTGHIELNIDTPNFLKMKAAMVSLAVSNQDLAELNIFLHPNAGVNLKGQLIHGLGFVNMTGRHEAVKLNAVYKNLEVKVEPHVQRSELESYFTNLGASLVFNPENLKFAPTDQSRSIETDRQEKESLVGFMLRGLKEAAIQVAMVSKKK